MKTRLEEVEDMLKVVEDDLDNAIWITGDRNRIETLIAEKVKLEVEKSKLSF